jgi:NADP-dependent 3-hydroxy acid dehydrogenase YdfG
MDSILITGAASGIGAATVKKIASPNIAFTLTTKSNKEGLEILPNLLKKKVLMLIFYMET